MSTKAKIQKVRAEVEAHEERGWLKGYEEGLAKREEQIVDLQSALEVRNETIREMREAMKKRNETSSAPTTAREALALAWELAHPVKKGQVIPEGTDYLSNDKRKLPAIMRSGYSFTLSSWGEANIRTLEPLPEPEPDWLDAPAVLAVHDSYTAPSIWGKHWDQEGSAGIYQSALTTGSAHWSELRDVTPLYPREDQS